MLAVETALFKVSALLFIACISPLKAWVVPLKAWVVAPLPNEGFASLIISGSLALEPPASFEGLPTVLYTVVTETLTALPCILSNLDLIVLNADITPAEPGAVIVNLLLGILVFFIFTTAL